MVINWSGGLHHAKKSEVRWSPRDALGPHPNIPPHRVLWDPAWVLWACEVAGWDRPRLLGTGVRFPPGVWSCVGHVDDHVGVQ